MDRNAGNLKSAGKRQGTVIPVVFVFLLLILSFCLPVSAQGEDPAAGPEVKQTVLDILNGNISNIFPITSQRERFTEFEEPWYSDVGPQTVVRIGTEFGKKNIILYANADSVHDYLAYHKINDAYPSDFHMTMDVTMNDVFPEKQAGCFVGFTNYGITANQYKGTPTEVIFLINGQESEIFSKGHFADSGTHHVIGSTTRRSGKLTIAHLMGHTFVYINDAYLGQFHDGMKGPLQLIFGAAVFSEGDTADCTFDNLVIRKVSFDQ